jgi:acyl carrier protein
MPPEDQVLQKICALFEQELGAADVGPDTHFIFSGGDSLNAESLVVAISNEFSIRLRTSILLEAPTPREMARLVMDILARQSA